tara:strand:- start:63543 stop:64574 length:1032 start_codon:yes stop_codon:yes gene_type:complete
VNVLGDGNNYAMYKCMKIAIIGNGIAAWCVNKYLLNKDSSLNILRFGNDEFIRTCSLRTTSINCMRGTQKGISPLGDLMVDSMEEFLSYYQDYPLRAVEKTYEMQCWQAEDSKFSKRFKDYTQISSIEEIELSKKMFAYKSDAYLIHPLKLYHEFNLKDVSGNLVKEVIQLDSGFKIIADSGEFQVDKVILCAAGFNELFKDLITNEDALDFIQRTKPVKGDYLYLKAEHGIKAKSIAIENHHLIFRENEILIGSTSFNDNAIHAINHSELRAVYEHIVDSIRFQLPSYDSFDAICGIRSKGRKRTPYWNQVADDVYMVGGLYKNAFSFAFKAAADLTDLILK